jgi:hypothetical protein
MQLRDARIERWDCRTRLDTPIINQMGAIMLTSVNATHRYFIRASLSPGPRWLAAELAITLWPDLRQAKEPPMPEAGQRQWPAICFHTEVPALPFRPGGFDVSRSARAANLLP